MNNAMTRTQAEAGTEPSARTFTPLTDIVETAEAIHVMMDMPGVAPDGVEIDLDKRILNVRGRCNPAASDQFELVHAEYAEGDYERAFSLGEDFDPDKIEATIQNGVLSLVLPRAEAAKPKRIKIKTG